jgi:hypothetical protein
VWCSLVQSSLAKIYVLLNICTSSCISAIEHTKQRWYLDFRNHQAFYQVRTCRCALLIFVSTFGHPPADSLGLLLQLMGFKVSWPVSLGILAV